MAYFWQVSRHLFGGHHGQDLVDLFQLRLQAGESVTGPPTLGVGLRFQCRLRISCNR